MHTKDWVVEFKPSERGLHYVDMSVEGDVVQHMLVTADVSKGKNDECMMVTTVRGNLEGYTRHEIEKAQKARRLQGMIRNPTERELKGMVREKLITMFITLTGFLVLNLLTLGARRQGKNPSTLGWIT